MTFRVIISVLMLAVGISGCATTAQSKFSADTVGQIKRGMAKSQVTATLGEPRSRRVDSEDREVWQYRKDAQEGKGMKTYVNIASFGLLSGEDADFQDILSVFFKGNVVSKVTYEENVRRSNPFEKP